MLVLYFLGFATFFNEKLFAKYSVFAMLLRDLHCRLFIKLRHTKLRLKQTDSGFVISIETVIMFNCNEIWVDFVSTPTNKNPCWWELVHFFR